MRPLLLLPVFAQLVCAQRAEAQTPAQAPPEVVRLVGGSSLVGRVTATGDGKIHMFVDGVGDVVIDSAAVASRSPVPPPPPPPSPWTGTLTGSMTHISTVVPGVSGATLGSQVTLGVARSDANGPLTLDGNMSYWLLDPSGADLND